jgi:hypothetical protein
MWVPQVPILAPGKARTRRKKSCCQSTYSIFTNGVGSSVPHPFAFFLAKGWETTDFQEQN